jgi:ABC-type enterochelin transport system substrate-binding protein
MKKSIKFIAILMMATVALTSCDSNKKSSDKDDEKEQTDNPTSDAKKMAQLTCKIKELSKDGGYKKNEDEIKKLTREAEDIVDKYKKKEKGMSDTDKKDLEDKLKKAFEDESRNCDNKD